jgi:hypothetical protein
MLQKGGRVRGRAYLFDYSSDSKDYDGRIDTVASYYTLCHNKALNASGFRWCHVFEVYVYISARRYHCQEQEVFCDRQVATSSLANSSEGSLDKNEFGH